MGASEHCEETWTPEGEIRNQSSRTAVRPQIAAYEGKETSMFT